MSAFNVPFLITFTVPFLSQNRKSKFVFSRTLCPKEPLYQTITQNCLLSTNVQYCYGSLWHKPTPVQCRSFDDRRHFPWLISTPSSKKQQGNIGHKLLIVSRQCLNPRKMTSYPIGFTLFPHLINLIHLLLINIASLFLQWLINFQI